MKKIFLSCIATFALLIVAPVTFSDSLLQVYYDAVQSDPTFKKAESTWLSEREELAIAGSQYLPDILIQGMVQGNHWQNQPVQQTVNLNGNFYSDNLTINASQAIFNSAAWEGIKEARATVKSAAASYAAAAQDLMVRLADTYFAVMEAYETLRYTIANKNAVWRQLETANEKFKVGLIAITGVYDAKSRFDQAVAAEIQNQNELKNRLEDLRAITNLHYITLQGIPRQVPLIMPVPTDVNVWVQKTEHDNYSIKAAEYAMIAARYNIAQQEDQRMPVVDLEGQYFVGRTTGHVNAPPTSQSQSYIGFALNFPLYQGGLITAQSRQARYDYLTAGSQLDFVENEEVTQVRQAYLGIVSGISKVKADEQSIISAKNAYKATEAGYQVGTRTMVDVLNDLTAVFQAENQYTRDQYNYLRNIVALKQAAGTLSVKDIEGLSQWLSAVVRMPRRLKTYEELRKGPEKVSGYKFENFELKPSEESKYDRGLESDESRIRGSSEIEGIIKKETDQIPESEKNADINHIKELESVSGTKPESATTGTTTTQNNNINNNTQPYSTKPYFAIEIFTTRSAKEAKHFVALYKDNPHLYVLSDDGLYKVLYGRYTTISDAYLTLYKEMPGILKKHKATIITVYDHPKVPLVNLPEPTATDIEKIRITPSP